MVEEYSKDNPFTIYEVDAFKQALKDCNGYKTIFKYLSNYFYKVTHNEMSADDSELYYFNADRKSLAKDCELSVHSIDKYNDILVNNEIIYIHKHDYKYTDSNKQVPNAYGLYKNKDKIDEKCNEYISGLKDGVYQSIIPRGKGSKKLMEEAKKAKYTPVDEATDEELAEHDERHKALYAKRMAKKMEKEKTVVAESVPMKEVEEVVQADSKKETVQADDNKVIDFEAIIAERKAETNAILSDSNKEVETDDDYSLDEYTDSKETDVDIEYCLNISSRNKAIDTYRKQLEDDDPFDMNDVQPKLIAEFTDKWDSEHKEKESEPFDDDDEIDEDNPFA